MSKTLEELKVAERAALEAYNVEINKTLPYFKAWNEAMSATLQAERELRRAANVAKEQEAK